MIITQGATVIRPFYVGTPALTITVSLSKNGGAFATSAGGVTEISGGWYYVNLQPADTSTLGALAYLLAGAGLPALAGLPLDTVVTAASAAFPIVVE